MKSSATHRYAAIVLALLLVLPALRPARAQVNTSVQTCYSASVSSVHFPWRAGSLAVASLDNAFVEAAVPGVYISGVAFLFPTQQKWVSTGAGPIALVSADLDGDGDLDVAVAEKDGGSVSILTNDGLGNFTRTASLATGNSTGPLYPTAIVAADIDHDGRLDLVVANSGANTVVVLHNSGAGFVLTQTVAVVGEPRALATGDFDGDTWSDVAATCAADDTVKVLRNDHGLLSLAGTYDAGPAPDAIAAGDLNNDGKLDLAAADTEAPQVTVLLNDGTGRFTSKAVMLSEPNAWFETPVDLQLVDLDQDGLVDIRCAGMTIRNAGAGNFEVANSSTLTGAVYGQGFLSSDPAIYLGVAYSTTPYTTNTVKVTRSAPVPFACIHISPTGKDTNDGLTWATAKHTVSAGITAAQPGQQVWVAAGTYTEASLTTGVALYGGFAGSETALSQRDWLAHPTMLNSAVQTSQSTSSTRIDGFVIHGTVTCGGAPTIANNTISNSSGSGISDGYGSGSSSPTIVGNTITNNTGCGILLLSSACPLIMNNTITHNGGGGIYCSNTSPPNFSSPVISGNTISSNDTGSRTASISDGGGICCSGGFPLITGNTIVDNTVLSSSPCGGGIYYDAVSVSCFATITGNTITGNRASKGGGIWCRPSSSCDYYPASTIAGNLITGNMATVSGGGIYCPYYPTLVIANNTIVGNSAGTTGGGGIYGYATIVNTIVAFNTSGIYGANPGSYRNNCVYGNSEYNYANMTDPTGTSGNISVDPGFADRIYGNLHIQPDSPCRDAGDSSAVGQTCTTDIDGQPRQLGPNVDIGADESDGTLWPSGPNVIVRVSPSGNDANDGSSWPLAKRTVQAALDAATLGGEVWVAEGTYKKAIRLTGYVQLYGGFAGTETQRFARDWTRHPTILDANQAGTVVTIATAYRAGTIDGFAIRNGDAYFTSSYCGGGVYCLSSSPTIANCAITHNTANSGGGIYCASSATIVNTLIASNTASFGGGIYCRGSATIAGCTIANNNASPSSGGIYCDSASPSIANTIVASNSSGICLTGTGTPSLRHNCVYGNTAYNYSGLADPTGTDGNLSADPRFICLPAPLLYPLSDTSDQYGDMRLLPGSPCLDAGDNADVPADASDLDGNGNTTEPVPFDLARQPRFIGTVDIGAYEGAHVPGDITGDSHVDALDLLALAGSFGRAPGQSGFDPGCDFNHDGTIDVVDLLYLADNWGR